MLAEDLCSGVSLNSLRSGVPGSDAALGVQHKDRILRYSFDEQAELLFLSARFDLGQKDLHLLLQTNHTAQAFFFGRELAVTFFRDYTGVFVTNLLQRIRMLFPAKSLHRICAAQRKRECSSHLVPELFDSDGG